MFEALFAKKATHEMSNGEEGALGAAPHIVKIGGQEFMAGDPSSSKAFDAWAAKAKANGEIIPVGNEGAHYPIDSTMGKAEMIKAELQIKHGVDPVAAQKAVDQIPGLKAPAAKPFIIYKNGKATDTTESAPVEAAPAKAVIKKGSAKADTSEVTEGTKPFRGPRGPVGH